MPKGILGALHAIMTNECIYYSLIAQFPRAEIPHLDPHPVTSSFIAYCFSKVKPRYCHMKNSGKTIS